ncbi:hypothetical protein HRbin16_02235 [bacterium HR16]|nr:hypothetical protein HRbin16_02235 [bacterium HR16]
MMPPEVPTRRGMSCWTVGLLSCLGAIALVVAGLAILFIYTARRPEFKQAMSTMTQVAQCQQNMHEIHAAIERYRQRNKGEYPKSLNDLVPRYLPEAGKLKCPADVSGEPVSYRYFPLKKDSPETSPLLQCDHHKMMNQKMPVIMLKNGEVLSGSGVGGRSSSPGYD